MKLNEKKLNLYFSIFLLVGMISVVAVNTLLGLKDTKEHLIIQLIAGIGAIMGVVNTVLSANGNIWTFLFGLLDVVCCSIVYFKSGIIGTFALHAFYFLPMQFIGWWQWQRRGAGIKAEINEQGEKETAKVKARRLSLKQWFYISAGFVCGTALCYAVLYYIDYKQLQAGAISYIDNQKILLDSSVVMLNIIGQILMSTAYMEQWYIWNIVNIFSILLWTNRIISPDSGNYTVVMLIKYVFYFLNSLNGLRIWLKLSKPVSDEGQPNIKHRCC